MKYALKTGCSILVFLLLFSFFSCKKHNPKRELRIDFGTYFDNDHVRLSLDDEVIFDETLSTNNTVSVSKIFKANFPIGKYKLIVEIDGSTKSEKFRHKEGQFIYISLKDSQIGIEFPDDYYYYD